MSYTIKSLGFGQVAVLQNGKHVKKFGGASAATDARMFINKQHQASLPKERAPGLKEHELVKELEGINNNIGSFTEDMLEQFEVSEINNMIENYQSFEKTVAILEEKGAKSSKAMAAFIGRKKYSGKKCVESVEDSEQLDELKKSTLSSYIDKAAGGGTEGLAFKGWLAGRKSKEDDAEAHNKAYSKAKTRSIGIQTAAKKLAKESVEDLEESFKVGKEYTHQQLMDKIKTGNWEATTDIKPGKHVEMRHHSGKRVMVKVGYDPVKESVEDLEEAVKLGSRVKIHAPGKDYHGKIGNVGEVRHGPYKGAPKTYTVDYDDNKSVQLDKKNVKLHTESVEYIEEKLTEKDPSSKWIEDFIKSDNPKFAGKSKKERIKMALGAYYGKQNEEFDALAEEIAGLFEDSEQLDELKKSTLASYIKKAANKTYHAGYIAGQGKYSKQAGEYADKRKKGIDKAVNKLTAEALEIVEQFEQLDELKKSTLASYIKKASFHIGTNGMAAGFNPVGSKESKEANKRMGKRHSGVIKAASKLAKESFADYMFGGEVIKEEIQLPELQEADKNYDAYFKACMKNAGITSISDLKTPEEKKEFMNKVDAGFKAKNEDMFYENFMRSDIDAKIADHEKSGNKVADVTHKIYQGKPYAEFTVTTPDGAKKKYVFHGNVTRHEKLA